jgi:hypothetical protein
MIWLVRESVNCENDIRSLHNFFPDNYDAIRLARYAGQGESKAVSGSSGIR